MFHRALFLLLALAVSVQAVDTMPKFFGEVRNRQGDAQSGARVLVTLTGTGTNATLYADDEATVKVNPLTTDSTGLYQFKAAPGIYDIAVSVNGQVIDQRAHVPMGNLTATVSSVALLMPAEYSVAGSPITTTGTFAVTKATQTANTVWAGPGSGGAAVPTFRALVALDIPSLDAAKITTGQLALARGGTHADLSATGGTGKVLKQSSVGADITVATITSADIATALTTPGAIGGTTPGSGAFTTISATGQVTSTLATGTPPLVIASTTNVPNLYVARATLADGVTTDANLTGVITSVGNATSIASQTGTGTKVVVDNGPTLIAPLLGTPASGVLTNCTGLPLTSGVTGIVPIANGGTNSATALSGSSLMVSDGTHIVQGTAGTTTTVLHGNASGTPTYGAVSLTADVSGILPIANGGTNASTAATARSNLSLAITDWPMHLEAPTAKNYYLLPASNVAYTINNLYAGTVSGTCTVAVKINGTAVTGLSAVAITSTPSTTNATAANSVSIGDTVTIVVSSPSSCVDLFCNVKMTR